MASDDENDNGREEREGRKEGRNTEQLPKYRLALNVNPSEEHKRYAVTEGTQRYAVIINCSAEILLDQSEYTVLSFCFVLV